MKKFIIKEEVAQGILNYLATKPYQEVFQLVLALQGLEPVQEEEKEEEKKNG